MITFTRDELAAFAHAIVEALESIGSRDFQARTGFSRDEFLRLLRKVNAAISAEEGEEKRAWDG